MMRMHFGLLSIPSFYPHCFFLILFFSFHSSYTKHYSVFPHCLPLWYFLTLFVFFCHQPFLQISAPCLPLTLMPLSLSLPSSVPPPPVLHSTSLHSGFAPNTMSFLQLPLSLPTLIPPSPPLPLLLLSTTPTAESSTARYWRWSILSFSLTLYIHPPCSHASQHNWSYLGHCFGSQNIQFTRLWWYCIWIHLFSGFRSRSRQQEFLVLVGFHPLHTCTNTMEVILHSLIVFC